MAQWDTIDATLLVSQYRENIALDVAQNHTEIIGKMVCMPLPENGLALSFLGWDCAGGCVSFV